MQVVNEYQFLPSLSLDEYEALRESIRENGVIEPVITDEAGRIIDGHHRVKACSELGIDYPTKVVGGLSEEQKQDLALELNMHRRHLTKEQKRGIATDLREKGWTQERIAARLGIDQSTISRWVGSMQMHKTDQLSPKPDETAKLREQVAYYERLTKELESRPPKVIEKVVEKPAEPRVDEAQIAEMVSERVQSRLREIEVEKVRQEEALKAQYRAMEDGCKARIAENEKKISEAQKLHLDVTELEKQKKSLAIELSGLTTERNIRLEDSKTRERLEKAQAAASSVYYILKTVDQRLAQSGDACGMGLDELAFYHTEMTNMSVAASQVAEKLGLVIEKVKKGGTLRVI